ARVDNDVTQAVTWLPWSGLPVASQRDLLVGLLESANGDIRRAAIGMLAGYGDPALVDLALGWLATAPDRTPVALELLVAHAWLLPERAPDALKQPWFSGASASAKAAIARWYDTPESDALLEKLAHSDDPDAAGIAVREVVLRANTFFARQLAVAHCMRPFPLTASTIAALEPTPESAFATLKRIVDQRQPKMLSQERSSPDYLLALSLALHNDDALREALKHGTLAGAQDRAALLALYRDEEGAKARADALKSYSQGLLHLTPLLVHLGDEATVIAALKTAAESRSIPASIDIVALTRALASDAAQPSMRSLIDICTKPNDDKLFAACALPLSLNITREPYLDLLASIAIRRDTESFRRLLVMAAAGSPALDTAWINARREAWESSKRESTDRVFALLDAIAERSESALLGFALDAMREGGDTNMRLPSLFAAARLGSRHALIAAVNETLGVESALGEPLRFPSSPNAAAFRLGDYCAGIPGSVKGMDRRIAFWQSTRHLWAWDVTSGMFTRRTGP
ncbi:MAG: hypothetical protein L6Q71_03295, partial [Planctomycetes bacterium]|nr:hypothetical protein [Planctomycetota bacterium]